MKEMHFALKTPIVQFPTFSVLNPFGLNSLGTNLKQPNKILLEFIGDS